MSRALALALCLGIAGCSGAAATKPGARAPDGDDTGPAADDTGLPPLTLSGVGAPGPHRVGHRVETLTYTSTAGERSLRLALWYPTAAESGDPVRYNNILEAEGVLGNASPLPGAHPLHVYSHGHQGYAEASGFFMEHLASHGFVVAAPDHTGNTTFDGSDRETAIYHLRAADISAVIDHLLAGGSVGLSPEPTGITASGHSFGGYTLHALLGAQYDPALIAACLDGSDTSAYCSTMTEADAALLAGGLADPRIVAGISMAPGDFRLFGTAGLAAVGTPLLHMTGTLDPQTGDDAAPIWDALAAADAGHHRVDITGGGHMTFTDYSGVLESMDGLIPADRGFEIVDSYGLAWLAHQRGTLDAGPLFDGSVEVDSAAAVLP